MAESLLSAEKTALGVAAGFRFEADLEVFAGHFPDRPLVPGVFLIEAVRSSCERVVRAPLRIAELTEAKFVSQVEPGDAVRVEGRLEEADTGLLTCSVGVSTARGLAAKVRLRLERG